MTGRLAEASLREVVARLSSELGFRYQIAVPGIQVAALLHTDLLLRRLHVPVEVDRVIVPGWCQGKLSDLEQRFGRPFERGPKNLHDLPEYFGREKRGVVSLDQYSIEIVAEINHATRQPVGDIVREAVTLAADGGDVIDVGCVPGESSSRVGEIVSALRAEGLRVSIDSFDRGEVEQAVNAGAELILSCNHSNMDWVTQFGVEVVAIPNEPSDMESLRRIIARLDQEAVPFRIDPIIEPIGAGFTASLARFLEIRREYPELPMMMGVGNLTELTEVDSAGINVILAAVCEELRIHSVLTTQVINWCRSAVAELNAARRLMHYALTRQVIPKHVDSSLVMLRDPRLRPESPGSLQALAAALTDPNFRIFAEPGGLHLMNRDGHWQGGDAFEVFAGAAESVRESLDPGHAFYLGYEMARAELARHLGKEYIQDAPMRWGLLGDWQASGTIHDQRSGCDGGDYEDDSGA